MPLVIKLSINELKLSQPIDLVTDKKKIKLQIWNQLGVQIEYLI